MEKARELKNDIFDEVKSFPIGEKYLLVDQLIRSSRSINSQILEGYGRRTYPDRIRFCVQGRGSLSETLNHLIDAFDCKYISEDRLSYYRKKVTIIEKLLNGYISWLEKQNK
ncbi:MAG TPA: four helix bundle protein [Chitinophagaceae bacterium]|jgi:four helix bundle protein|nr:four helix bundle protein [Chitinophagaceae bacterium]